MERSTRFENFTVEKSFKQIRHFLRDWERLKEISRGIIKSKFLMNGRLLDLNRNLVMEETCFSSSLCPDQHSISISRR
eukprot:750088-Hanusia_phi.AAC.2